VKRLLQKIIYGFIVRVKFIFEKKPNVKNSIETIEYILETKKSVSRFGDGEFDLIEGKSLKFQEYDERLATKLKEVLKENVENLVVCIPDIYNFSTLKTLKNESCVFWLRYIINNHKKLTRLIDINRLYYDACVTRPYIRYNKKYNSISNELFEKLKRIWNKKDILIVEGEFSRLGVNNDLFSNAKSIKRIICPSKNAFGKYAKIFEAIEKNSKDRIIIMSLGPTATVLAFDLAKKNLNAIDLGHIDVEYEWYLNKAETKMPIKNKIVNEINESYDIENIEDSLYNDSIIEKIL